MNGPRAKRTPKYVGDSIISIGSAGYNDSESEDSGFGVPAHPKSRSKKFTAAAAARKSKRVGSEVTYVPRYPTSTSRSHQFSVFAFILAFLVAVWLVVLYLQVYGFMKGFNGDYIVVRNGHAHKGSSAYSGHGLLAPTPENADAPDENWGIRIKGHENADKYKENNENNKNGTLQEYSTNVKQNEVDGMDAVQSRSQTGFGLSPNPYSMYLYEFSIDGAYSSEGESDGAGADASVTHRQFARYPSTGFIPNLDYRSVVSYQLCCQASDRSLVCANGESITMDHVLECFLRGDASAASNLESQDASVENAFLLVYASPNSFSDAKCYFSWWTLSQKT